MNAMFSTLFPSEGETYLMGLGLLALVVSALGTIRLLYVIKSLSVRLDRIEKSLSNARQTDSIAKASESN